jgi:hypothetical protein
MTRIWSIVVTVAWGLWLGGLITLFAVVGTVFNTPGYSRDQQGDFAQRLFPVFERMQLVFAATALLATVAWWVARRRRLKLVLFALFAAATLTVVLESTQITPKILQLTADRMRETPQFQEAHKLSTRVYGTGACILLLAGLLLPSAVRGDVVVVTTSPTPPSGKAEETEPA